MKSIFKEKYMDKTIVNSAMTAAELKEARQGKGKIYNSVNELFADLVI